MKDILERIYKTEQTNKVCRNKSISNRENPINTRKTAVNHIDSSNRMENNKTSLTSFLKPPFSFSPIKNHINVGSNSASHYRSPNLNGA